MAMIVCPECGKEISEKAHYCPACGYPIAPEPKERVIQQTVVKGGCLTQILLALFIIAVIGHIPVTVGSGRKKKKRPLLYWVIKETKKLRKAWKTCVSTWKRTREEKISLADTVR